MTCSNKFIKPFCVSMALFLLKTANASADPCEFLRKRKSPTVVLLDKSGNLMREAVDLGVLKFPSDFEAEYHKISTEYRLIAYPSTLFFQPLVSGSGYVNLERTKAVCKDALTFKVDVYMNFDRGDARPYRFNYRFPDVMMQDLPTTPARDANEVMYFKPEIFGAIVRSKK